MISQNYDLDDFADYLVEETSFVEEVESWGNGFRAERLEEEEIVDAIYSMDQGKLDLLYRIEEMGRKSNNVEKNLECSIEEIWESTATNSRLKEMYNEMVLGVGKGRIRTSAMGRRYLEHLYDYEKIVETA